MTTLKVMCWNVENLFLPPPGDAPAAEQFQRKLANLAAVIDQQQPNVLALQEIGPVGHCRRCRRPSAPPCPMPAVASAMAGGYGWPFSPAMRFSNTGTSSPSPR